MRSLRQPVVNQIVPLAKIMKLEVDNNDTDERKKLWMRVIVVYLRMIEKAWERVTNITITSAWKKSWPESNFDQLETTSL